MPRVPRRRDGRCQVLGANQRDVITLDSDSRVKALVMNEPLPPIDRSDRINFRGLTLDGSNAPDGSDGIVLDGTSDAEISEVTLIGWDGDGIRVTNGSSGSTFRMVEIESVGDAEIFIDTDSSFNSFTQLTVSMMRVVLVSRFLATAVTTPLATCLLKAMEVMGSISLLEQIAISSISSLS